MKSHYKILHTTCHPGWGGLEKRIFNEWVWMEKDGHKMVIAAPKNTPLYKKAKTHGFKVYHISFSRLLFIKDYQRLKHIFKTETPDVMNTHGINDSKTALIAAYRTSVPCRILSHHFCAREKTSLLKKYIYKKISTAIFTHSDSAAANLKKTYNIRDLKIFKIPAGILSPIDEMLSKPVAKQKLIQEFSLEPNANFIRLVTNFEKSIDFNTVIKGLKKIETLLPNHHIIITDLHEEKVDLKKRFKKILERVQKYDLGHKFHLLNGKENHWLLSNAFDCQITPVPPNKYNLIEETLHTLLMSMYCRCPVISDSNQIRDILISGETCRLFHPNDSSDLAENMIRSINQKDETEQQVKKAHHLVVKNHQMHTTCEYILKLYRILQIKSDNPQRNSHFID